MKKRSTALAIAFLLALSLLPFSAMAADGSEAGSGYTASQWAQNELAEAERFSLIPESLRTADLTAPIMRQEFAAISVRVYEFLTGGPVEGAGASPFSDTDDTEVVKAYFLGVTNGTGLDRDGKAIFSPSLPLSRETLATMLTRVYKKYAFDGWTLGTDTKYTEQFREEFTMPEPFADDESISDWARDSVYFMYANRIVLGVGGNSFALRPVTGAEQDAGYAVATREEALAMAVRMVKNLG